MSMQAVNITKRFGQFAALDNVDLEIPRGELVALLGPSGSGKTTLLRIIAGLEFADAGSVRFDGNDISDQTARERRVGFVFQHYALFRHMTVFENIAFGLQVRPRQYRPSNAQTRAKVHELLKLIQLETLAQRYPSQLSGGQRQRVALARALAVEPGVLLLDEPFGALDAKVRMELRRWLRQLHDEIHVTSVFVTHDQEEALEVADRVVVMNNGRIEQVGSPEEVYNRPATPFVYNFLGNVNLFHAGLTMAKPIFTKKRPGTSSMSGRTRWRLIAFPMAAATSIKHINSAGPLVKVEAITEWGDPVHVEMAQDRFRNLQLTKNENVFIIPKDLKVFENEKKVANRK